LKDPNIEDKPYHKEGWIDPKKEMVKELTEEEKQALAMKQEQESIDRMISRAKCFK